MRANIMKINGTLWMPKYDEKSALWYVDMDGSAYSAESIDALEAKLQGLGYRVFRYPAR